ncbi:MAG: heparan-alpha-glucosaminide N-acetyltransferase domain-containing protein [Candidatus Marinimicrobia bacterium]|nr:heparan-alpha-glucosaminide N-acetyltransferase domain-containing protein [Candidatus Neomarinimicrobiota bacterium]MDD5582265.1 heparan-alpha-glucosaminide N-acetyltransferase domain-containing protein [Candidatus Neomarinimicrobiota bacterium]
MADLKKDRIEAIDVFRGLTIFLMFLVIAIGAGGYKDLPHTRSWFGSLPISTWNHAEVGWEYFVEEKIAEGFTEEEIAAMPEATLKNVGLTLTDLVAPFFIFIVGLCLPLSRTKHGREWWSHVINRTVKLILLGILYMSLILGLSWWWGILQAIGVSYFMAAVSLKMNRKGRWIAVFSIFGFHIIMSQFTSWWLNFGNSPDPFFTISTLHGNMLKPLRVHCLPWVSISYGALTIIGVMLGEAVATKDYKRILKDSFRLGIIFMIIGYAIHKIGLISGITKLCFNKPDVTASYSLFTAGLACVIFGFLYWLVDVKKRKGWIFPFQQLGMNALLAYFMQIIMRIFFRALHLEPFFAGEPNDQLLQWAGLWSWPGWQTFLLDKTGYHGLFWALLWSVCLWLCVYAFNKRNIYWKL